MAVIRFDALKHGLRDISVHWVAARHKLYFKYWTDFERYRAVPRVIVTLLNVIKYFIQLFYFVVGWFSFKCDVQISNSFQFFFVIFFSFFMHFRLKFVTNREIRFFFFCHCCKIVFGFLIVVNISINSNMISFNRFGEISWINLAFNVYSISR